ncbi:N-acetyltransferase [Halobacillus andaensis]|uniref:N-acetyltransferase n=1 Tax=Halobacillus andaensis TaxID=1176239 RepID=A0A917B2E7_HALAA|nr:GNAT family N-acetyltransferase [Halobacillus andaensis]MBP2004028.1 putative GNAT family N-acyltransferase [Halobacillus andaensis]GGF15246.1 N-acetyltransferase [Halobacillus andaensis]
MALDLRTVTNEQERQDAFTVRKEVFINEQNVSVEDEHDEYDETATHIVGYIDGEPLMAARLRFVGEYGKFERICVAKSHRGQSLGKQVIEYMEMVTRDGGYQKAKLNAQTHAEGFYKSLGYETVSEEFMDAGIPHVTMIKVL